MNPDARVSDEDRLVAEEIVRISSSRDRAERRVEYLETALLGVLDGTYSGSSGMARTFACVVMGHPAIRPDEGCFCTIEHPGREVERRASVYYAAPDLLEALEEIAHSTMDAHELAHLSDMQQEDIRTARAAIAKVKGEA